MQEASDHEHSNIITIATETSKQKKVWACENVGPVSSVGTPSDSGSKGPRFESLPGQQIVSLSKTLSPYSSTAEVWDNFMWFNVYLQLCYILLVLLHKTWISLRARNLRQEEW